MTKVPKYYELEQLSQQEADALFGSKIGAITGREWGCGVDDRGVLWHVPMFKFQNAGVYQWDAEAAGWQMVVVNYQSND